GSKSEGQWRDEFKAAGLFVREPDQTDVHVGIQRVYGAFKRGQLFIFDDLAELLEELATYAYATDDKGESLPEIEDKSIYHNLDALRYIVAPLKRQAIQSFQIGMAPPGQGSIVDRAPQGVFW